MNFIQNLKYIIPSAVSSAIITCAVAIYMSHPAYEKKPDTLTDYVGQLCDKQSPPGVKAVMSHGAPRGFTCKVPVLQGKFVEGHLYYQFFYSLENYTTGLMQVEMHLLSGPPEGEKVDIIGNLRQPVHTGTFFHKGGNYWE